MLVRHVLLHSLLLHEIAFAMDALALQVEASRRTGRMAALGCSTRDLLVFFLGAAATASCVVLLQPAAPPCPYGLVAPEDYQELEALGNGTDHAAPSPCSLVAPAGQHQELAATLGNGTVHADPCTTKPADMAATSPDDNLPELLRLAAMDDKTVILTLTNEAFSAPGSLLDLFLHSFRVGVRTRHLLRHLVIVAVDGKAYERCRRVHRLCYHLRDTNGTTTTHDDYSPELPFMKGNYLDMMWRRNRFQARVLGLGYSFVFTDVDIVWLRNPLLRIPVGADIAMSCDKYYGDNPYDLDKKANGGLVYARASARTAAFYEGWYEAGRARPGKNEQDVFDEVKRELAARHGVAAQFVDTVYFGWFCDRRRNGRDFNKLCTYHGNCLVGMKTKLRKLTQVFVEWNKFRTKAKLTD